MERFRRGNDSKTCPDCSLTVPSTESFWILPSVKPFGTSLARASHKAMVQEKVMWVVGGYTFNYSSFQMILNYNLESGVWNTVPISGGPVPRYGHSLAAYQDDIYMFGGKLEASWGNVTDELWVFNIPSRTWQRRSPAAGSPTQAQVYAVEGHTAHCVQLSTGETVMLVIFGYSPIYSYISNVQEYNLSESQQLLFKSGTVW
ncbi:Attractin-like protein 1 [Ameca splendens]|uniref:Attractin-like protein 1 n=1 Tax=Ameca splendens TaxID=208324 RepID=A0ABV0XTU0_9TELE